MRIDQPFTRAEARAAGIPTHTLCPPTFRRLFRNCYVSADLPVTIRLLAGAAAHVTNAEFVTHHSAARLLGAPAGAEATVHVGAIDRRHTTRVSGIRMHLYTTAPPTVSANGLRVTSAVQTFLDLAAVLGLVELVTVGDSFVASGHCRPHELVDAAHEAVGRGARLARRAAALVREGVESPMETRTRLLLVLAGLPEPQINVPVVVAGRVRRIDLSFPDARVGVEYDGRHHRETEQWAADLRRREELEAEGWRLIVLLAEDIYRHPEQTLRRVRDALAAAGRSYRLRDEWRSYFAV